MTAVLPNNAYYVSLDGSRRVTQRTRSHIKPIAIFPLHAGDVCYGKPRPGASSDASVIAQQDALPVPVTADPTVSEETPAVEPAHAPTLSEDAIKIERLVDGAPTRAASSSPVSRRRSDLPLPATVSQPAHRAPIASRLPPPVDDVAPRRKRGRPRKRPEPEPVAEPIADPEARADRNSAGHASRRTLPPVRPDEASTDPAWQPRVALSRLEHSLLRPETRPGKTSVASGRRPDQPEAARARSVTRSGRVSRPPLFYGLGGDVEH